MSKNTITTIGSSVLDIMFKTNEGLLIKTPKDLKRQKLLAFEYGAKINSDNVQFCFGGGALNTLMTFYNLSLKPLIVTSLGEDAVGRDVLRQLKSMRISTNWTQISKNNGTSISFVISLKGKNDRVIFNYPGATTDIYISAAAAAKIRTPWIYLSSLHSTKWQPSLNNIFSKAARKDIKVAWNPGRQELAAGFSNLKKYFHRSEVLLVNTDEAAELLLSSGEKLKDTKPKELIRKLHNFGQNITVITDGAGGAYVYDGKKMLFKSALKNKKVVNTTGAGDAFGAAFISGLIIYRNNLSRSLALAIHNSGNVITKVGGQNGILTRRQFKKLNI